MKVRKRKTKETNRPIFSKKSIDIILEASYNIRVERRWGNDS